MAKQRRNYTREFKLEAVRRIAAEGKSLAEVARELGLGESRLRSWKTALAAEGEQAFPGKGHLPALEQELRRLRAENQRPRIEREVLRKATAFFARESS
jgi:transposase